MSSIQVPSTHPAPKRRSRTAGNKRTPATGINHHRVVRRRRPPIPRIVGQGGYFTDAARSFGKKYIPEGSFARLGKAGGRALGTYFGVPSVGKKFGELAGSHLAKIAGFGEYNVKANSLLAEVQEGVAIPQFGDAKHATIVRHREFVQDIVVPATPATFTNVSFPMNPGNSSFFPWLSPVAEQYEQYMMLGCILEFKTTFADITAGGALGSVIMASEYDVLDSAYTAKIDMENSQYAVSEKPSCSMVHAIECDPGATFSPIKFIRRNNAAVTGSDARLYDHCNFQIATVGLPAGAAAGSTIGELWISYEVALFKPQIGAGSILVDHFSLDLGISTSNYLKSTAGPGPANANSTLGGSISGSTYTFPSTVTRGRYMSIYSAKGTAAALAVVLGQAVGANIAVQNLWENNSTNFTRVAAAAVSDRQLSAQTWTVTGPAASIVINQGTLPTAITGADFWVIALGTNQN